MAAGKKIRKAYENINRDAFYKLDDAVKKLAEGVEKARNDAGGARILVAMEFELGGKVPKEDLDLLAAGKDAYNDTFLKIYRADRLTEAELS